MFPSLAHFISKPLPSALSSLDFGVAATIVEQLSQLFSEAIGTIALLSTLIFKLEKALVPVSRIDLDDGGGSF